MPKAASGALMSSASRTLMDGSSARMIGNGSTMNAAAKKHMMRLRLRRAELRSLRASSILRSAMAFDIFGKIAVAMDTAISEYGSM